MSYDLKALRLRTVDIDYRHGHRHLPGSLSALEIIAAIYDVMTDGDVFILSKGHACAAHFAVLESKGFRPDVTKVHPERDPANGITMTAGSLGHGFPTAVGIAWAKRLRGESGRVHVLLGDGECQEGSNFEAALLARRLDLSDRLAVHVDRNGWQGSEPAHGPAVETLAIIFPLMIHETKKGAGIPMFENHPEKSTHAVTAEDYANILAALN